MSIQVRAALRSDRMQNVENVVVGPAHRAPADHVARRFTLAVGTVEIGAEHDQALDHRQGLLLDGQMQRRVAVLVHKIDFRLVRQQGDHALDVVLLHHHVERRFLQEVDGIHITATRNQFLQHLARSAPVQRGSSVFHLFGGQLLRVQLTANSYRLCGGEERN